MRCFFLSLAIIAAISDAHAQGWQEVGNGGEVIYCEGPTGAVVSMLDTFEVGLNRMKVQWKYDFSSDSLKLATQLLNRLPKEASELRHWAQELTDQFYQDAHFVAGMELIEIPDSGRKYSLPIGCGLFQLISQRPPRGSESFFYLVDADTWNLMNPDQQAVAIVHEVLYRMALTRGKLNSSQPIRKIVGLLLADQWNSYSDWQRYRILNSANLWLPEWMPFAPMAEDF